MTSSSCIELEEQKRMYKTKSDHTNYKPLTDFSIDSIIGNEHDKSKRTSLVENKNLKTRSTEGLSTNVKKEVESNNNNNNMLLIKKYRPKNFQCVVCKMAFSNNGQLKNHVRIHTGERPFRCNYSDCNKTFTRNEELTRHKLIHTGVRPHCCNSCGKRFGRKDHLKKHIRTHDRKKYKRKVITSAPIKRPTIEMNINKMKTLPIVEDNFFVPLVNKKLEKIPTPTTIVQTNTYKRLLPEEMSISHANIVPVTSNAGFQFPQQSITNSTLYHQHTILNSQSIIEQTPIKFPSPIISTTPDAIQQFANDYWNKWYNLIGFCQQQHFGQPAPALAPPHQNQHQHQTRK